ncbi:MAG: OB-fold nucleic acid binding domain-containing protein, partial [Egibacteraceae bacterium]
ERLAWSGACDALAGEEGASSVPGGGGLSSPGHIVRSQPTPGGAAAPVSPRRVALWQLGVAAPAQPLAATGDTQLALPLDLPAPPRLGALEAWEAMVADYATTGVSIARHPMTLLRGGLAGRGALTSAELARTAHGTTVRIAGLVVARQRPATANGVVFLLLEDEHGTVNVIVPPPVYERDRLAVRAEPLVLAEGRLERHAAGGGAINVVARALRALQAPGHDARVHAPSAREAGSESTNGAAEEEGREAAGGDFRAVAPPAMSFAQGRRR